MFPWLWFYAPHYQLPWSGDWQQSIDPDTSFFSDIKPGAGVGERNAHAALERLRQADYGAYQRLLALAPQEPVAPASAFQIEDQKWLQRPSRLRRPLSKQ